MPSKRTREAIAWLKANKNPEPIAINRFGVAKNNKPNALRYVKALYAAGAQRVEVDNVDEHPRQADFTGRTTKLPGPYTDSLVVSMSTKQERAVRKAIHDKKWEPTSVACETKGKSGHTVCKLWWD